MDNAGAKASFLPEAERDQLVMQLRKELVI